MATYPNFQYTTGLSVQRSDGRINVRASNGALKSRLLYSQEKRTFDIMHELSRAQRSALDTFYNTNRDLNVTYVPPGETTSYTVRFAAPPQYQAGVGEWCSVRVQLIEV